MSYEIDLTASQVAALVNSDEQAKQYVVALYLNQNAPTLKITDLKDDAKDSLSLQSDTLSVPVGGTAQVGIAVTGNSDVKVKVEDERIATAAYADGVLTVTGIAAGDVVVDITKGDQKAAVTVSVR